MFRFYIALWMAKLSVIALKLTGHNGTDFPGTIAYRICPSFMKYVGKPAKIVGISGTNGKTTVTNMVTDALTDRGLKVLSNREGSNIKTGIATIFMKGVSIFNKPKYDIGVIEIDERSVAVLFPYWKPDYMIINNLTRDSIMRNAHPEYIARILTEEMPASTKLILNGDDLIASGVAPDNDRVYFGIDEMDTDVDECINLINDMQICPKCNSKLEFDKVRYHHIGKAHCPECGFSTPECDYSGHNVDLDKMTITIREKDAETVYTLMNDSVFNIYNVVAVVALLREMGYSEAEVQAMLSKIGIVKTRFNERKIGSFTYIRQMSKEKNALASSRVFDYVSTRPGDKELVLMMNCLGDTHHWSENMCWLYDCDFEFLKNESIKNIIVTGERCYDYVLRLKFAGVDDSRVSVVPDEHDIPKALKLFPGSNVYLFYGTDSLEFSYKIGALIEKRMEEAAKEEGGAN